MMSNGDVLTETNPNDTALNDTSSYDSAGRLTQWDQAVRS